MMAVALLPETMAPVAVPASAGCRPPVDGVPVALATDDPGVSRGDITQEFERAAETYHLKYQDLKKFARASLEYSFLPGESLWKSRGSYEMKSECAGVESMSNSRPACEQLVRRSPKAEAELKLELTFDEFENHVTPPAKVRAPAASGKN